MADRIDLAAIAARPTIPDPVDGPLALVTEAERDALVAAAEWALDAPHHDGCEAHLNPPPKGPPWPCTCNRDAALAPFTEDPS